MGTTMTERALSSQRSGSSVTDICDGENRIIVKDICKSFSTRLQVLDNISFTVPPKRIVSLVGPTGCGKTTLLNIVGGFERPNSGAVLVDGVMVTEPSPRIGYVSQEANLFPWLSVWDNIRFGAKFGRGLRSDWRNQEELDGRAAAYLSRVGLEAARHQYPYQISGGMKARAALGRVLLTNPGILLLDEPFAALDALTRSDMHRLLLNMFQDDHERAGLLITHDVEEALLLSDTIYVLSRWPARIVERVDVPFAWPRDYDNLVQAPELATLKHEVLEVLRIITGTK